VNIFNIVWAFSLGTYFFVGIWLVEKALEGNERFKRHSPRVRFIARALVGFIWPILMVTEMIRALFYRKK